MLCLILEIEYIMSQNIYLIFICLFLSGCIGAEEKPRPDRISYEMVGLYKEKDSTQCLDGKWYRSAFFVVKFSNNNSQKCFIKTHKNKTLCFDNYINYFSDVDSSLITQNNCFDETVLDSLLPGQTKTYLIPKDQQGEKKKVLKRKYFFLFFNSPIITTNSMIVCPTFDLKEN